ncbi:19460_t:CDS:2 [Dentiscutata erythropus]|uniref:19460_t:CDS:1 n=1 Tax=Dentiscutata erythropus TaxID=1348616 RepID=A0A9N9CPZ2_9GLOM|nr:19460_t:CDS:2 [Dentiscutata erythropus]
MSLINLQERQELIQTYENQLKDYYKKFEELLSDLSWDIESLKIHEQESKSTITCPFNSAHKVPTKSYEKHYRRCELKYHGITECGKRKKLPSSTFFYENAPAVITLTKDGSMNLGVGQSLTVSQRLELYEREIAISNQIREENQRQKRDEYQNFDEVWKAVQKKKGENQGQKSRTELLAEQRDYKRRRKSYRAKNIKITQHLIAAYMEDFKLLREFEKEMESQTQFP